jgi:Flp pilus assembly protein TadD
VQHGDHVAAERYFRVILRVTPEDPQAQNNLAWVLVTQPAPRAAELHEGLALARRAADTDDQAYIWDTLAESHYRLQQYEAAIHAASKALLLAEAGAGRGDVPLHYYRERLAAFSHHGRGA